jgi:hypothetical protein
LLTIGAVAGAIMAAESRGGEYERPSRVAFGLLTWLTSGNWPAKIGAGLLVVGVGALLRFALKNLDIDPTLKLAGGIAISGLLAGAAVFAGNGPQRRAVSLALGGAAFGVAYLTAYSSFALFGYLDSETGTALLLLTAVGASIYAVTRSALSLAILSMFGAFLAPAFAVTDPGPTVVYGYYVVASLVIRSARLATAHSFELHIHARRRRRICVDVAILRRRLREHHAARGARVGCDSRRDAGLRAPGCLRHLAAAARLRIHPRVTRRRCAVGSAAGGFRRSIVVDDWRPRRHLAARGRNDARHA